MTELTSKNVTDIFNICLCDESQENTDLCVKVEGVAITMAFNKTKLEEHKTEIIDMLMQLDDNFLDTKGGGWSFLNACMTKDGNQWTGMHSVVEQLMTLGMGIDRVKYLMPREAWRILPGGVPYFVITTTDTTSTPTFTEEPADLKTHYEENDKKCDTFLKEHQ